VSKAISNNSFSTSLRQNSESPNRRNVGVSLQSVDRSIHCASNTNSRSVDESLMDSLDLDDRTPQLSADTGSFLAILGRPRREIYLDPPPILEQWMDDKKGNPQSRQSETSQRRTCAYLILSHDKGFEKGIIEQTRKEMVEISQGREDIIFQVQGPSDCEYLYIEGPSQEVVAGCLDEARTAANNMIDDKSVRLDPLLIELPAPPLESMEVVVDTGETGFRPRLLTSVASSVDSHDVTLQKSYFEKFQLQHLTSVLQKAGRIKDKVNLRVRFGHYHLTGFLVEPFMERSDGLYLSFEQFGEFMHNRHTSGIFETQVGDLERALQVLHVIKSNDRLFLSEDMATATADVQPEFYFDADSTSYRYEVDLRPRGLLDLGKRRENVTLKATSIRAIKKIMPMIGTHLSFKTLSLDRYVNKYIILQPKT
jgi:hypothetical protein